MCRLLSHKAPQFHGAVRELIYFPVLYQQVFLWPCLSGEFRQARSSRFKIFQNCAWHEIFKTILYCYIFCISNWLLRLQSCSCNCYCCREISAKFVFHMIDLLFLSKISTWWKMFRSVLHLSYFFLYHKLIIKVPVMLL